MNICMLCPRKCGVDRSNTTGWCGSGDKIKLSRAALHYWEEPCISGTNGSGAVFFSGCSLRCVFCQNYTISAENFGMEVSVERLREIFLSLISKGAHNINLVTPTHFIDKILPALEPKLPVPVIYNCGGYESIDTLRMLEGKIDVYMPDIKYAIPEVALKYSMAGDYPDTAFAAVTEMLRQTGYPVFDNSGLLKKGIILRHLIIPNETKNSFAVIKRISESFAKGSYLFSLMSQYTPCGKAKDIPRISRRITPSEYNRVRSYMEKCGIENGYIQELSSADGEYIPSFDLEGVIE